ncbi:VOC family protein [Alkalihalobacterium elongatum]|uniref:hypothetical protein n=1 Tax=Alkalihalobacterium elongatum TaxID=2675466 RepID=UPI001C1F988F|nr:hypothetical protein [Alkalihalobacterium elongatum]
MKVGLFLILKPVWDVLLNLKEFGHLFIVPTTNGTGIVLDSKIFSEENIFKTPPFHFDTNNIEEAYEFLKGKNVEVTTEIGHNHWFKFKDPYGNHLMVCKC